MDNERRDCSQRDKTPGEALCNLLTAHLEGKPVEEIEALQEEFGNKTVEFFDRPGVGISATIGGKVYSNLNEQPEGEESPERPLEIPIVILEGTIPIPCPECKCPKVLPRYKWLSEWFFCPRCHETFREVTEKFLEAQNADL